MGTYFSLIIRNIRNLLLFVSIRNSPRIVKTQVSCCLFKIINNQSRSYLFQLVPSPNIRYFARNSENIPHFRTKQDFFKNSFFPTTIKEWKNLDPHIRKSKSISIFKINILKFIRPKPNNVYYCNNPKGTRLLTKLRLGLSHLCKHKFKHSFQECFNARCLTAVRKLKHLPTTSFTSLYKQKNNTSEQNQKY